MKFCFMNCIEMQKKWVQNRKITFPKIQNLNTFLYSNNEIWEYTINKDSGELTAFYMEKIEDNYTQLVCSVFLLF
jgi:hypothetical protein